MPVPPPTNFTITLSSTLAPSGTLYDAVFDAVKALNTFVPSPLYLISYLAVAGPPPGEWLDFTIQLADGRSRVVHTWLDANKLCWVGGVEVTGFWKMSEVRKIGDLLNTLVALHGGTI